MIKIHYRARALEDLSAINTYYSDISKQTAETVYQDILSALEVLQLFPQSGSPFIDGTRKFVSSKHRFSIVYIYDDPALNIVAVYRHQNR